MNKIEVIGLTKNYPGLDVINDINMSVANGEFVSLLGPSGCGKSTLLNLVAGLEVPTQGKILIDGQEFTGIAGRVSFMHQKDLLLPWKNIIDNVCMPLYLRNIKKSDAHKKAKEYFEDFGLIGFENYFPNQLSGGMRQRAALLRTYLYSNDIFLLDEPFKALDAITRKKMQKWLKKLISKLKSTSILVTHEVDEALILSDKIYIMSHRPGILIDVIDVDVNRDIKDFEMSHEYLDIKKKILGLLE